jgi:hypothetical protein
MKRHAENGLPIYPSDQVVPRDSYTLFSPSLPSFVRRAVIGRPFREFVRVNGISLALEIADLEFNDLAEFCGAQVVPHAWGLVRDECGSPQSTHRSIPGYHLVAEVETIISQSPDDPIQDAQQISTGIARYRASMRSYSYYDTKQSQFMHGSVREGDPANWLTDIDLLIRPTES